MRLSARRPPLAILSGLLLGCLALLALTPAAHAKVRSTLYNPVMVAEDGLDWGTGKDAAGHRLQAGDRIEMTLRLGNGIAGQAGYASRRIPRRPQFLTGPTRVLHHPGQGGGRGDVAVGVRLPFAFPFGGLRERTASVSSDGRISFGSPAWSSWGAAAEDGRGIAAVVGDFERGIMPFWGDLRGTATLIKMVTPAGGRAVAFQWEAPQRGGPPRSFQLVLFRDGRFRFDYPGRNARGGHEAFVGYSPGVGPGRFQPVPTRAGSVPAASVLFSPRPVKAAKAVAAGRLLLSLPPEVTPDLPHECRELQGQTICFIPALKPGAETARTISFRAPGAQGVAKKGVSIPGPLGYGGAYAVGGRVLASDDDEVAPVGHRHDGPNWLSLMPFYSTSSPPVVGEWAEFGVAVSPHAGEVQNATVTVTAPPAVGDFRASAFGTICSGEDAAGEVSCAFSDAGEEYLSIKVLMRPLEAAVGAPLTLPVSVTSPEFAPVSATASSPPVVASP
jgi:hypothetical protein